MPIEIRELVIRTSVANEPSPQVESGSASATDRQALVQEVVDKVLEVLEKKKHR